MTHTLTWYKPDQILYLALDGQPDLPEMETINQEVLSMIDTHPSKLGIMINITHMEPGYHTAEMLRTTQKYMDHSNLEEAFIVTDSKLNRLIALMAFCTARVKFSQFDSVEMVEQMLNRRDFAR
jgi:hypothetical protein